jgi:F-box interacting protein
MYNPSIGLKSQSSPKINYMPDWWMEYIGFGYDQVNDKYKVLVVECMDPNLDEEFGQSLTKIYTFGEDSWRTIQELPRPLTEDLGKYVNGTLNWIGTNNFRHLIISFDLNKETYRDVLVPQNIFEGGSRCNYSLYVLDDCLCFCFANKTHFVVWLMKEYGVIESWAKLMTIPWENLIFKNFVNQFSNIKLLFISENGVVLLMVSNQICLYNLNSGVLDHPFISISNVSDQPVIYRENLISQRW